MPLGFLVSIELLYNYIVHFTMANKIRNEIKLIRLPNVIWELAALPPFSSTTQTAALTVQALLHSYAANSQLVTMGHCTFAPKLPPPWTDPKTHLFALFDL